MPTYPGISSGGGTIPLQGTAAARPAANTVAPGTIYWATDTGEISVTNLAASAWQQIARITPNLTLVGSVTWTAGASLNSSGAPAVTTPNPIDITAAGKGLQIAEGANAKQGTTGAMTAGSVTVANTSVTANSRILVCRMAGGTNPGAWYVSAQTAGTSFVATSTNAADTGNGIFLILEPG